MTRFFYIVLILIVISGIYFFVFTNISRFQRQGAELQPVQSATGNIVVISPLPGDSVTPGNMSVKGTARVFENQFSVRLKAGGKIIYENSVYANAPDAGQFGDFEISIPISAKDIHGTSDLMLEVFDNSPKDGKEIDQVFIPLSAGL